MLTTNQSQSSSSSSRVATKSSQRILTSSSSSEMKASSMKSDLRELQRGISEMKNNISTNFSQRLRSSMENLVDRLVSHFYSRLFLSFIFYIKLNRIISDLMCTENERILYRMIVLMLKIFIILYFT